MLILALRKLSHPVIVVSRPRCWLNSFWSAADLGIANLILVLKFHHSKLTDSDRIWLVKTIGKRGAQALIFSVFSSQNCVQWVFSSLLYTFGMVDLRIQPRAWNFGHVHITGYRMFRADPYTPKKAVRETCISRLTQEETCTSYMLSCASFLLYKFLHRVSWVLIFLILPQVASFRVLWKCLRLFSSAYKLCGLSAVDS